MNYFSHQHIDFVPNKLITPNVKRHCILVFSHLKNNRVLKSARHIGFIIYNRNTKDYGFIPIPKSPTLSFKTMISVAGMVGLLNEKSILFNAKKGTLVKV